MTPLELLLSAREKIDTPEKWAQGDLGLDADGKPSQSPDTSICFCMYGALRAAIGGKSWDFPSDPSFMEARRVLKRAINGAHISEFNDATERTHSEVLAAFDQAIALAREAES